ncbi:MAG: pyridoxamine 5'-phosphate oxidase [Flavobacteriales bacterium]|nr:pyridoxamine 5'-phosphate oxidase [Flavobacteriales bacterium]
MANIGDDITNKRVDYQRSILIQSNLVADPFQQVQTWLDDAKAEDPEHFNAFCLSTISESGFPHSRLVLLRGIEKHGLVFFTNYDSQKGKDIAFSEKVSANFFWPAIERQLRVRGVARKISAQESDEYFASRPRESRIGAIASAQSDPLNSREELEDRVAELTEKYAGKDIPRPTNWGGYAIQPHYLEFWQGRASRLHDRIAYLMNADGEWFTQRLNP